MKKIWITGATGRVGSTLVRLLDFREYEILPTDISEVDITSEEEVYRYMSITHPDVVINCSGMTDVQKCEQNKELAYKINAIGARNLAVQSQNIDAKLIQISTDDVFDSKTHIMYNEFDTVKPTTIYGKSKYAGECMVSSLMTRYVIIRSSWVYGTGTDFVNRVLSCVGKQNELYVSHNRYACPTSVWELAKIILVLIEHDMYGLYHIACKGSCSRYDFAKEILRLSNNTDKIKLSPTSNLTDNCAHYSILDNLMLRISNIKEPLDWQYALEQYIRNKGGKSSC